MAAASSPHLGVNASPASNALVPTSRLFVLELAAMCKSGSDHSAVAHCLVDLLDAATKRTHAARSSLTPLRSTPR